MTLRSAPDPSTRMPMSCTWRPAIIGWFCSCPIPPQIVVAPSGVSFNLSLSVT